MEEFLEQDYETLKQKTRYASWAGLKLACENQAVAAPSYKTFCVAVTKPASFESNTKTSRSAGKLQVGDVLLGVGSENAPAR